MSDEGAISPNNVLTVCHYLEAFVPTRAFPEGLIVLFCDKRNVCSVFRVHATP